MSNAWRTFDRLLPKVFLALVIFVVAGGITLYTWQAIVPAFTNAGDVHVTDPVAAVRDARALIAVPSAHREWIMPDELPPTLRLPHLHHANVHDDHVDLILARNPDASIGARIWAERHRPHHDQPTRYRDIWFYGYTNDLPVGESNIP